MKKNHAGVVDGRRQGAEDNSKAVSLNDYSNASCSDEENHADAVAGRRQVAIDYIYCYSLDAMLKISILIVTFKCSMKSI